MGWASTLARRDSRCGPALKAAALASLVGMVLLGSTPVPNRINNIVLVHGAWADGSGWEGVYRILKGKGYNVVVVPNPNTSLADDVKITKAVLATQEGPVILVGHSYGGAIITEAGDGPNVAGLVYVAAFAPDAGESLLKMQQAGLAAFTTDLTNAAWKSKKSWYIVSKKDHMIPPDVERMMAKRAGSTVTEIDASHAVYVSHAAEVAAVIEKAAAGATAQ